MEIEYDWIVWELSENIRTGTVRIMTESLQETDRWFSELEQRKRTVWIWSGNNIVSIFREKVLQAIPL